jgi:hypothetical protein
MKKHGIGFGAASNKYCTFGVFFWLFILAVTCFVVVFFVDVVAVVVLVVVVVFVFTLYIYIVF